MITRDIIDINKLVDSIHAAEGARRKSWITWKAFAEERGVHPWLYADYVTGLYTLRAWLRGKLHRLNPPEKIRNFNRSVKDDNLPYKLVEWDATKHNQEIAEKAAESFFLLEAATG